MVESGNLGTMGKESFLSEELSPQRLKPHSEQGIYRIAEALRHPKERATLESRTAIGFGDDQGVEATYAMVPEPIPSVPGGGNPGQAAPARLEGD